MGSAFPVIVVPAGELVLVLVNSAPSYLLNKYE